MLGVGVLTSAVTINIAATPSVTYKGGRYYLIKDGVKQDSFYTQSHTATAAAINLAFQCDCMIEVEYPSIFVSVSQDSEVPSEAVVDYDTATLTWTTPTKRVDGTTLEEDEISHYIITSIDPEGVVTSHVSEGDNELVLINLVEGLHTYAIQVVDVDGNISNPSESVSKLITKDQ